MYFLLENQRTERLWQVVWCIVVSNYYATFTYLEDVGLLDPGQDLNIICLYHVFLARLDWHLDVGQASAFNRGKQVFTVVMGGWSAFEAPRKS